MAKQLSYEQWRDVRSALDATPFRVFREFVATRELNKSVEVSQLSESINSFLLREQAMGAAAELRVLLEEFTNHVDRELKDSEQQELTK